MRQWTHLKPETSGAYPRGRKTQYKHRSKWACQAWAQQCTHTGFHWTDHSSVPNYAGSCSSSCLSISLKERKMRILQDEMHRRPLQLQILVQRPLRARHSANTSYSTQKIKGNRNIHVWPKKLNCSCLYIQERRTGARQPHKMAVPHPRTYQMEGASVPLISRKS